MASCMLVTPLWYYQTVNMLKILITLYWPFLTFCPSKKHQYLFIKALSHIQIICMHKLMCFYTTQQMQPKTEHHIMFVMTLILWTYSTVCVTICSFRQLEKHVSVCVVIYLGTYVSQGQKLLRDMFVTDSLRLTSTSDVLAVVRSFSSSLCMEVSCCSLCFSWNSVIPALGPPLYKSTQMQKQRYYDNELQMQWLWYKHVMIV